MLREALFRLSQEPHLHDFATHNPLAWQFASRFVAGVTLDHALAVVRSLNGQGMTATLDHLGENVSSRDAAREAARTYASDLRAIAGAGLESNISIKLTQLGLDLDEEFTYENALTVVSQAAELKTFVRIDMEGSAYVQRTLDTFYRLFERHPNVGIVIQSYLYRSKDDLERLLRVGARVRLVKGAYLENSAVAYQDKAEVDRNYVALMKMLLDSGTYPAIATHDPAMIAATRDYARQNAKGSESFEFQMLYGIRRDLQTQLVHDGYRMRIYVPYGTEWYPYLMRRLAERPANVMFVTRGLVQEALQGIRLGRR